jgi:Peptidase C13 family
MGRFYLSLTCAITFVAASGMAQSPPSGQSATSWEQNRPATWELSQHQRLSTALAALKPQRPGIVDAYVVVAALDADPVFAREASETTKVLARRFDASGRVILLAAGDPSLPNGSPSFLAAALAAVAAKMNLREDALILYTTSHGAPNAGIVYRENNLGYGNITPDRLSDLLDQLHIERRLIMISACFAGQFVGPLASPSSAIIAAADDDRTSFGCAPGNDWTFFGDALINNALRQPQPIEAAAAQAFALINDWEFSKGLTSSKPRLFMGDQARLWLAALEKRMPQGKTAKVGRPAFESEGAPPAATKSPIDAK